jgi:hypothetical protein
MATIRRVKITGDKEVRRKLTTILKKTGQIDQTSEHYGLFLLTNLRFWEESIYDTFDNRLSLHLPTSGQLGKSLRIRCNTANNTINFSMRNLPHSGRAGEGGGYTKDYGKYLRNGSPPSRGKYISWEGEVGSGKVDKKVLLDYAYTAGVSKSYWKQWMGKFRPVIRRTFLNMIDMMYKEASR